MAAEHMRCPRDHTSLYRREDGTYRCKGCARADHVENAVYEQDDLTDTRDRVDRRNETSN